jgi:UDP-N-acetylglucosamine--N-acetylmuramyl-(pentapeptide) pyrophosphoryl-undecaprenol N-acetylglucosamine transferase
MSPGAVTARIVITGGGTGGHVFPGLALATAVKRALPEADIRFIGSSDRLEARLVPAAGWTFRGIIARGLKGMGVLRTATNAGALPVGLIQAAWHLSRFWPRLVVGMGGFVAGPVVAAAWLLRRKIAIHEQNLTPGWTNRALAGLADLVMVSYPETGGFFPGRRVLVTGNPVRDMALAGGREAGGGGAFRLLVLGGSQGARGLNRMVTAAVERMMKAGLEITHQTGAADEEWVRRTYEGMKVRAEVVPFIEDMGRAYSRADLVVCRAGATTMAELAVNGCPAVLVPFAGAADAHQEKNAAYLAGRGAAVVVADTGQAGGLELALTLERLRRDEGERRSLARAIGQQARPEAAAAMAGACLELIGAIARP